MGKLFIVTLTLISMVLQVVLLTSLWGWFVVPLGVSPIGYAHAFGLNILVTYFQVRSQKIFKPDVLVKRSYRKRIGTNIGLQITALILGYIATLFM
jgi:hypothetical protein